MKILHLLDEPWDSGLCAYALHIAGLLQSQGHHVVVGVVPGKKPEALAKSKNIKTVAMASFFDLRRVLRAESWDIVNAHTGRTHTWSALCFLLKTFRGPRPALIRTRADARPLAIHLGTRLVYRQTQAVVAASQHVADQFLSFFPSVRERVGVVYPSVALGSVPDQNYPHNTVGILGRLDPIKGHSIFIEAAARVLEKMPDVRFLVAGQDANISTALLLNHARQLGIEASIRFVGFQPSAFDFMRQCSLGVIASIGSEEVSRACLEWMAAGRPVVATLVGCLPELVDTEETGLLVPPQDFVALADGILQILKNPERGEAWGRRARSVAEAHFSDAVFLDKTTALYANALKRLRAP